MIAMLYACSSLMHVPLCVIVMFTHPQAPHTPGTSLRCGHCDETKQGGGIRYDMKSTELTHIYSDTGVIHCGSSFDLMCMGLSSFATWAHGTSYHSTSRKQLRAGQAAIKSNMQ